MSFDSEVFKLYIDIMITGISSGFALGFIAWGIGFGIDSIIKWFKMA